MTSPSTPPERDATLERHNLNVDFYGEHPYSDIRERFFPFPVNSAPGDSNQDPDLPEKIINFRLIEECSSAPPESVLERYYLMLASEVVSNEHHLPPIQKCAYLQLLAEIYRLDTLIETGILWGTTSLYLKDKFKRIYTIDLDPVSCRLAERLFNGTQVEVTEGDSAEAMPRVLNNLHENALFFLDGHSETDTPILAELEAIAKHTHKFHVIVIDDLACFSRGGNNYPSRHTMQEVAGRLFPEHEIVFELGFILLLPLGKSDCLKLWHSRTEGKAMIWPRIALRVQETQRGQAHSSIATNYWQDATTFRLAQEIDEEIRKTGGESLLDY